MTTFCIAFYEYYLSTHSVECKQGTISCTLLRKKSCYAWRITFQKIGCQMWHYENYETISCWPYKKIKNSPNIIAQKNFHSKNSLDWQTFDFPFNFFRETREKYKFYEDMKPLGQVTKSDRGHRENNAEQIISVVRLMFKIVQCTVNQIIRKDDFLKLLLPLHFLLFI